MMVTCHDNGELWWDTSGSLINLSCHQSMLSLLWTTSHIIAFWIISLIKYQHVSDVGTRCNLYIAEHRTLIFVSRQDLFEKNIKFLVNTGSNLTRALMRIPNESSLIISSLSPSYVCNITIEIKGVFSKSDNSFQFCKEQILHLVSFIYFLCKTESNSLLIIINQKYSWNNNLWLSRVLII